MRGKNSISEIDAQIAKLHEKRRNLVVKASERFGRAAAKAGLVELEISDVELDALFEEIAGRFRDGKAAGAADDPARPAASRARTEAAAHHDQHGEE